jgi:hypothetical protein
VWHTVHHSRTAFRSNPQDNNQVRATERTYQHAAGCPLSELSGRNLLAASISIETSSCISATARGNRGIGHRIPAFALPDSGGIMPSFTDRSASERRAGASRYPPHGQSSVRRAERRRRVEKVVRLVGGHDLRRRVFRCHQLLRRQGRGPVSVVSTHVVAGKDVHDEKARTKRRLDGCAVMETELWPANHML